MPRVSLLQNTRAFVVCGVVATLLGAFASWSHGGGVNLSGIEASQNAWMSILTLPLAVAALGPLRRRTLPSIGAITIVALVALRQVLGNSTVPNLSVGWGWWLSLFGGLLLASAAVASGCARFSTRAEQPMHRPVGRRQWTGVIALVAAAIVLAIANSILTVGERASWPPPPGAIRAAEAKAATQEFAAIDPSPGDLGLDYAWSSIASIEPWPEGAIFFPRIFEDIEDATSSVHIIMYGWTSSDVGTELATLLESKLSEGVEVRILVDSVGSDVFGRSQEMYLGLADAGAEIVVNDMLPLDRDGLLGDRHIDWTQDEVGSAEHRKLYIVDGVVAWTGGAGVEDHFRNGRFHDVMVRVTGDVVLQLQSVFLTSFASHKAPLPDDLDDYFPTQPEPGSDPAAVLQVVPGGFVSATQQIRDMIDSSVESLDIMNPYFTDPDIIERIANAAERGVDVRLVVPARLNRSEPEAAFRHRYEELLAAGVEIWEYPDGMPHAKLVIADTTVHFGTVNLDAWSLYRDFEVAIVADSPKAADLFRERVFEPDIAQSVKGVAPTGATRLTNWIFDKFTWFM